MTTLDDALDGVEGWLSSSDARTISKLVQRCVVDHPGLPVLEIGSFQGRSTIAIAFGLEGVDVKVTAIDPHEGNARGATVGPGAAVPEGFFFDPTRSSLEANLDAVGMTDRVSVVESTSDDVYKTWDSPLCFVFIDGLHDVDNVQRDARFGEHVVPGGVMVFHDYRSNWPGVDEVVGDLLLFGGWRERGQTGSMIVLEKEA